MNAHQQTLRHLVTATAVLALAAGLTGCQSPLDDADSGAGAAQRTAAASASASASASVTAPTQTATPAATQSPARQPLTEGWTAYLRRPSATRGVELFVADPAGRSRAIATVPDQAVITDISTDGQHIALLDREASRVVVVAVATGRQSTFRAENVDQLRFTRPAGTALYLVQGEFDPAGHYTGSVVSRRTLTGRLDKVLGQVGDGTELLPSPEGTRYLQASGTAFEVHRHADGALVTSTPFPQDYRSCRARRWTAADTVTVACDRGGDRVFGRVFALHLTDGHYTALTPATPDRRAGFGYADVVTTRHGTWVTALSTCGAGGFGRQGADGRLVPFTFPAARSGEHASLVAAGAEHLAIALHADCGGPASPSLVTHDLAQGTFTIVVDGRAGGVITSVAAYGMHH